MPQAYLNQQKRYGFVVLLDTSVLPEIRDKQAETGLYLIIQEALTNVRKHANVSHMWSAIATRRPLVDRGDRGRRAGLRCGPANHAVFEPFALRPSQHARTGWLAGRKRRDRVASSRSRRWHVAQGAIPLARLMTPPREDTASWLVASLKAGQSDAAIKNPLIGETRGLQVAGGRWQVGRGQVA